MVFTEISNDGVINIPQKHDYVSLKVVAILKNIVIGLKRLLKFCNFSSYIFFVGSTEKSKIEFIGGKLMPSCRFSVAFFTLSTFRISSKLDVIKDFEKHLKKFHLLNITIFTTIYPLDTGIK